MKNNKLYQAACDKWGKYEQLTVAIEELSELIKEVCKDMRDIGNVGNIAEEVADVEIMCEQLRFIYSIDKLVDEFKAYKLKRLRQRVDEE